MPTKKRKKNLRMRPKQLAELLNANIDQLAVLFGNLGPTPIGAFVAHAEYDPEEDDVLIVCETAKLQDVREDELVAQAYYEDQAAQLLFEQCYCQACQAERQAEREAEKATLN